MFVAAWKTAEAFVVVGFIVDGENEGTKLSNLVAAWSSKGEVRRPDR